MDSYISAEKAKTILQKQTLRQGVTKYIFLMDAVWKTDVSSDRSFQSTYRDFYQMRRFYSDDFASRYFSLMEHLKESKVISFKMVFERVKHIQNTYEISFSSKLTHTLDPAFPVWDQVVTVKHFGIHAPAGAMDREKRIIDRYQFYCDQYAAYMHSDEGQTLIHLFDHEFPGNQISDVKKIDFILWQDR